MTEVPLRSKPGDKREKEKTGTHPLIDLSLSLDFFSNIPVIVAFSKSSDFLNKKNYFFILLKDFHYNLVGEIDIVGLLQLGQH